MSGQSFGKYRLERRLAFGGMAEIFLASLSGQDGFEKRMVVKRILPQFGTDPTFVQMFKDEAMVAGRLSHPNLVQVYDFGDVDGVYFMAMEYVDGVDLRKLLRDSNDQGRPLSFAEVAALGEGICRGLSYAHNLIDERVGALEIVHRDISPHNVMVSRGGDVKVMDFGIAKAAARATHTSTGTIKGKVAYMAPEQASGKAVDKRCDQFSLGLVLWECLTGHRLFEGSSNLEVLRKVMECNTAPVSSLRADVPAELEGIVMRALSLDPAARYADLRDMETALTEFRFALGRGGLVQLSALVGDLVVETPAPRRTQPLTAEDPATQIDAPRESHASMMDTVPVAHATTSLPSEVAPEPMAWKRWLALAALALVTVGAISLTRNLWSTARPTSTSLVQEVSATTITLPVSSNPLGAHIKIDGMDTGLVTPAKLPGVRVGQVLNLELSLTAHEPWVQQVAVRSQSQQVVANLLQSPATIAAIAVTPEAETVGQKSKSKNRSHNKNQAEGQGKLSLRSAGVWVEVFLGNKKLGTTPLSDVDVPAGRLDLRLVNHEASVDQTLSVEVQSGGHVRRTVTPK